MSRKNWSFNKKNPYFAANSKDSGNAPEYPPFTADELNSLDLGHLGLIVKDDCGRVYMNVRYTELAAATGPLGTGGAAQGYVVSFPNATAVTTHAVAGNVTASTTAVIKTTQNFQVKDGFKNWFIGGQGAGTAGTIAGFIRRIYSDDSFEDVGGASVANLQRLTVSEYKKHELARDKYDGNKLVNTAGADVGFTNGITTLGIWRGMTDVVLADSAAADIQSIPVGVTLGAVTPVTNALVSPLETTDTSGTPAVYRSTWIQIFGPGFVYVRNGVNTTINTSMLYASTNLGEGLVTTLASSALLYAQRVGMALATDATAAARLVPVFISPGYYSFIMGI